MRKKAVKEKSLLEQNKEIKHLFEAQKDVMSHNKKGKSNSDDC